MASKMFILVLEAKKIKNRDLMVRRCSVVFSVLFLFGIFGMAAFKVLALVSGHYLLCNNLSGRNAVIASWIYSLATLYFNNRYDGYQFQSILSILAPLDELKGAGIRWHIVYNFNILRTISFTMDKYFAQTSASMEFHKIDAPKSEMQYSERCKTSHPIEQYNYLNFLYYVFYAPFYLAGPIITFNDFLHQTIEKPVSNNWKSNLKYLARWIFAFVLMETMMHMFYVVSIKNQNAWKQYTPIQVFLFGFFNLKMIWLKLLVIWRFFRCWGMLNGIESVENMGRCMSNHYSGIDFWRTWHTSYNKWYLKLIGW